ncbi:MAG: alpha/beta hydrolase-fold protein [Acidobacteria bacterium]|nr:alpha/beta hydrolase-fold protein [Acidobacteriota bacterium]
MPDHFALRRVGRLAAVAIGLALGAAAAPEAQPARIETVELHSPAAGRPMKYEVVLPSGYHDPANAERRYPTLYLLHGEGRSFLAWREILDAAAVAGEREMILVMPDAGESYYVNWSRTDDGRRDAWEDYLVDDVVGHVDARYRTVAARAGRAVAGFGMGGYGALTVGLRHADRFVSVGSQSGRIDYARLAAERLRLGGEADPPRGFTPEAEARRRADDPRIGLAGFSSIVDRTPRGQPFVTAAEAEAHDPFLLVMRVRRSNLPFIQLDSGTAGPYLVTNQAFAGMLIDADIPFHFTQRRGRHDIDYWREAYRYALDVHYETMRRALERREP